MAGARIHVSRAPLRWFWRSPLAIAALLTGVTTTAIVDRAIAGLADAAAVRVEMERAAARIAAMAAAESYVASDGTARERVVDAGGGIVVRTAIEPLRGTDELRLIARVGAQRFEYMFPRLAGGSSPVFGRALTVAKGTHVPAQWRGGAVAEPQDLPTLACAAAGGAASRLFTPEPGIALLRLAGGTDRADFVLAAEPGVGGAQRLHARGTEVVDGNLWVDCGAAPLQLELVDDLTVVVRGNVYLGRGITVVGDGHLTLVAVGAPGSAFVDRDGNGRWSAGDELRGAEHFEGPVEGAGNVFLGLPREGQGRLEFDVGLVVDGVLHVAVDQALVNGPVVLHHGGAPMPGRTGNLVASGRRLPALQRAALPGFATVGMPRPGSLQPLAGESLYPAGPPR